jgi:hypothetical protein
MQRPHLVVKKRALTLGLLALAVCATASATDVYQWKDAHGTTQYSSTPPAIGAYRTRTIHNDQVDVSGAKPTAKSTENPSCDIARKNIALLQGKEAVQIDSNGDGKPDKTLSGASHHEGQLHYDRGRQGRRTAEVTRRRGREQVRVKPRRLAWQTAHPFC